MKLPGSKGVLKKYYKGRFGRKIIAVICPELRSEFYADFAARLGERIEQKGGMMVLSATDFSKERAEHLFSYYSSFRHADGLILVDCGHFLEGAIAHMPVIEIAAHRYIQKADHISTDCTAAIDQAIAYLVEMGHREIGFIGETKTKRKYEVFCESLQAHGLKVHPEYAVQTDLRFGEGGYTAMKQLLSLKKRPTAIIAAYDDMALGALHCAHEEDLRIPEELSIIGMDNISTTAFLNVPLTTISIHSDELCQAAIDRIFYRIENPNCFSSQCISFEGQLVVRNSVAKITPPEE